MKRLDNSVREYLAKIGKKGGTAGKGTRKSRGSPSYYREMARRRWDKEKSDAS